MASKSIPWSRLGAEFVVIFLGVTVSLLADDWRSQREAHAAEQEALVGFRSDLLVDSASLSETATLLEATDRSTVWLRRRLGDGGVDRDTALRHMRQLGYDSPFWPQQSTYASLRAAGQLGVIRDVELRQAVTVYYEQAVPLMLDRDFLKTRRQQYIDLLFDHAVTPLPDSASSSWVSEGMEFSTSWDAYREDPRTEGAVALVGVAAGNAVALIQQVQGFNHQLRAALDSAISR